MRLVQVLANAENIVEILEGLFSKKLDKKTYPGFDTMDERLNEVCVRVKLKIGINTIFFYSP